jgi:hypothetical protein
MLIDVAIPAERNVSQKEAREIKCKSLSVEIQRMWNMKCMSLPVIMGTTGIVTKGLKKNLKAIPRKNRYIHQNRRLYFKHHT